MNKDKWMLIGGAGALGIGMIGTGVFLFGGLNDTKSTSETPVAVEQKQIKKTELQKKLAKKETIQTSYRSLITPVGYGEKEFHVEQSDTFKQQLLKEAEGGEVDRLIGMVSSKLENYRFSEPKNLEIAGLYADASFVKGLIGKSPEEMRKILPDSFKTPEMLALMPLFLPEEARRSLYKDSASLTPLNPGPWMIDDIRTIENREEADKDETYQDNGVAISMFNVIDGLSRIHVIEMSRTEDGDVPVRAYIGELNNGKLVLNGYYIPDGVKHYYKDVAFFEELDELYLKPNDEYQDKQVQKDIDEGKIPKKALDEFLNPTD